LVSGKGIEKQGKTDQALSALQAAAAHFERRGSDALWEPEVHRLMGGESSGEGRL